MTSAGQVVSTLAELMTVLVISQIRCAGAPIIIGGMPLAMDMHSGTFSFSAPEVYLTNAAVTEMIRFLGVPSYGTGGCSDAKTLDEQAAVECSVSSYLQVFSGTDLIHDVGFIESGMTTSFDVLVLTDEVIQTVKRFFNGMEIDEAHLALDVIHKVGPGGHFLSESHTLENFRKEYWLPGLMDRDNYETWREKGSMNFSERIKEKVKSILNNHRPLLIDGKKKTKIMEIINRRP
jgi:trimethylamine--corrinoid protein Co-methyltransferase